MNTPLQPHKKIADILVAGGGPAGISCAIAAARQGAKVILMHDRSMLGGNASSEIRMHILGADTGRKGADLRFESRETGIIEEIRLENAYRNPQRSPSMFDQILYEKCVAEPNLELHLDTRVTGARTEGDLIVEAEALCPATEDRYAIHANVYVDCTGDGGLGLAAGATYMRGREDKTLHGEKYGQEESDSKTLGSTLLLMGRKHNQPVRFIPPPWARKFTEEDLHLRPHASPTAGDYGLEYGLWWVEWGGHLDTIKDNATIRHELLSIVMGVWDHIKNDGDHGAECWALDWFGTVPGKRESRRFVGQYLLTENDILKSQPKADAIAYGGWAIDLHPPEGVDQPDLPPCVQIPVPQLYDIPLAATISQNIRNLMFAGRNLSATHVAFASTRIMATCSTVGEAVGIAAAHATQHQLTPAELTQRPEAINAIQQKILRQDGFLIGLQENAPGDYARMAEISASSETPDGLSSNVISGQTRAMYAQCDIPSARTHPGSHRWISKPGVPAWIELRWDTFIPFHEVEIVFDSGLHRCLTLSHSDAYHKSLIWGTGQPELVRAYDLEMETEFQGWTSIASVKENWQRRVHHRLETPMRINALRLTATASWGIDHARVVQIRVPAR